ncbi:hypothetical protein LEMLEM_LOCUS25726, partial [Lemmus lemmus]
YPHPRGHGVEPLLARQPWGPFPAPQTQAECGGASLSASSGSRRRRTRSPKSDSTRETASNKQRRKNYKPTVLLVCMSRQSVCLAKRSRTLLCGTTLKTWASRRARLIKGLAAKPDRLSGISGTHLVGGESPFQNCSLTSAHTQKN